MRMREVAHKCSIILCGVALLLATSWGEQDAPPPKYRVIKAEKPERTVKALNALADQRYRLVVSGPMLILGLEAARPDTYRYMVVDPDGGPVQFVNWLNQQGARGYRFVPGAGVMEKEPHPKNYEYTSPGGMRWMRKTSQVVSELTSDGYHPVGLVNFTALMGPTPVALLFERELKSKQSTSPTSPGAEIEVADAMGPRAVRKKVDALAQKGYRYLEPFVSQKGGGVAVLMQRCGQECEKPFEYRYFDVHEAGQLEKELNEQGESGFRVIPEGLSFRPHVLERAPGKKKTYTYHTVVKKDPVLLEGALNAPEQEGYAPIGYVQHTGFWTGEEILLLEKLSTVSAAP